MTTTLTTGFHKPNLDLSLAGLNEGAISPKG